MKLGGLGKDAIGEVVGRLPVERCEAGTIFQPCFGQVKKPQTPGVARKIRLLSTVREKCIHKFNDNFWFSSQVLRLLLEWLELSFLTGLDRQSTSGRSELEKLQVRFLSMQKQRQSANEVSAHGKTSMHFL